jgi:hypothetical protein
MTAAACVCALAACGNVTGSGADLAALRRAQDRWNARNIDDYRMTIRLQGGMIGGAAVITVRDGAPQSVQSIEPFEGMPASFFTPFDTVEDLFHILKVAHDNDSDRIDVEYHRELGVPMDVYIDPARNVVDEEHGFVVESFEVL